VEGADEGWPLSRLPLCVRATPMELSRRRGWLDSPRCAVAPLVPKAGPRLDGPVNGWIGPSERRGPVRGAAPSRTGSAGQGGVATASPAEDPLS